MILHPFSHDRYTLLKVDGLSVSFETAMGMVQAAQDICFQLQEGETLALVGETGCGKSVVASAIMQLLPGNASVKGRALFRGKDLLQLSERDMARIRGREIAMVFQNPSLALNPIIPIADQIAEPLQIHEGIPSDRSVRIAGDMLRRLGLGARGMGRMYPFQLSGGMNQRVMIATAIMLSPKIIIADEPSKGLDASLAREVMKELARVRDEMGAALILITHDLMLAKDISDRMAVMYCGQIVEMGSCGEIFKESLHPYTGALLNCLPEKGFVPIPGSSPSMIDPPRGCRFHPRCPICEKRCRGCPDMIRLNEREDGSAREVRCWRYSKL